MIKIALNIGLVCSLLIILLQAFAGFNEFFGFQYLSLVNVFNELSPILNLLVLIVLWRILVIFYEQSNLDYILRSMIILSIMTIMTLHLTFLHLGQVAMIILMVISIVNLILYFVFIYSVMEIDKSDIQQIDQLKNYGLVFVICLFSQLVLGIMKEFYRVKGLDYIKHLLILMPMIFIGLFFLKTKQLIREKK